MSAMWMTQHGATYPVGILRPIEERRTRTDSGTFGSVTWLNRGRRLKLPGNDTRGIP